MSRKMINPDLRPTIGSKVRDREDANLIGTIIDIIQDNFPFVIKWDNPQPPKLQPAQTITIESGLSIDIPEMLIEDDEVEQLTGSEFVLCLTEKGEE